MLQGVVQIDANSFYPYILLSLPNVDSKLKEFVQTLLDLRQQYKQLKDKAKEDVTKFTVNKLIGMLGSTLECYRQIYAPIIHAQIYEKARQTIDSITEFVNANKYIETDANLA